MGVMAGAGAWWLSLAIAFRWNRGDDVGRLPSLTAAFVAALAHGPLWGLAGLLASLAGAGLAGLIGLAWDGLGDTIAPRPPRHPDDDAPHPRRIAEGADLPLMGAAAGSP